MPTFVVITVVAITVAVVCLVVFRPALTAASGGKILAFLGFFILPVLAGTLGFQNHYERSKQTRFCLSCHVMQPYGKSLYIDDPAYIPAAHFQNNRIPRDEACYTCHTDYTMYTGGINAKIHGIRHLYVQYIGPVQQPIKLYQPFNNRECLHCHSGARNFEQGATHSAMMEDIKRNQMSCLSSGCHDMVHNAAKLDHLKYWSPQP